ncbi:MAG TPA: glycine cleavage system aminomethyltransferase GcvT [Gemmatimonadaceae bacterium]|nr:glycine cleavage system aminomethyltransferase GcvT [Gemmatimonadaceae bacterium]
MSLSAASQNLRHTPFHDIHAALGAKLVPFAGYEMPVQYPTGITAEHKAVREGCGLFDVSHMGEFMVRGKDAVPFVNYVTSNDVAALEEGQVQYSTILNEGGTIEDDCLVYRFADRVMMVVNASNREKDFEHISRYASRFEVTLDDISDDVALLALQGPHAEKILSRLTKTKLGDIEYYHFDEGDVAGIPTVVSRTGYTGEDGFELYFRPEFAAKMWDALTEKEDVTPVGLGARDTLRLEMGFALYGNDIDSTTTPLEGNLGWLVKLKKGDFVGRDALVRQKERGLERKLAGFVMRDKAFPRHGYPVFHSGQQHGLVRSGTVSPTLGIAIGTCYLPPEAAKEGTGIEVEIRGKRVQAEVVKMPFYKKGSHR